MFLNHSLLSFGVPTQQALSHITSLWLVMPKIRVPPCALSLSLSLSGRKAAFSLLPAEELHQWRLSLPKRRVPGNCDLVRLARKEILNQCALCTGKLRSRRNPKVRFLDPINWRIDGLMVDPVLPKKRGRPRKRPLPEAKNGADEKSVEECKKKERIARPVALVGRYVLKEFEGTKFLGKIIYYELGLYRVDYEDGDCEDLESGELRSILVEDSSFNADLNRRRRKLDKRLSAKRLKVSNVVQEEEVKPDVPLQNELCDVSTVEDKGGIVDEDANAASCSDSVCSEADVSERLESDALSLPPPPELPISSGNIGVPEDFVSHLLSVYGLLRSFSTTLFLCPFGLDDFVGAVNCQVPNTLLDSIHVALMRMLKNHLENLSSEGSEVASKCLRCIDWSLLDTLTWPVYVLNYLVVMGHLKSLESKGFCGKILDRDYYLLPVDIKLLILQILCDDALDDAHLRVDIDEREELEIGTDSDEVTTVPPENRPRRVHPRYTKTSACNNGSALEATAGSRVMDSHSFSVSKVNDSEVTEMVGEGGNVGEDGNGDECRLCGMVGVLLCCDGCPSAYHSRCIGVVKTHMPEGSWYCPECMVNKIGPKVSHGSLLKGGELFGMDPYEQVFMGTCNHLLVIKASVNGNPWCRYYNQKDILKVLQALSSSLQHATIYSDICKAIALHWDLPEDALPTPEIMSSQLIGEEGKTLPSPSETLDACCQTAQNTHAVKVEDADNVSEPAADTVALSTVQSSMNQNMENGDQVTSSNVQISLDQKMENVDQAKETADSSVGFVNQPTGPCNTTHSSASARSNTISSMHVQTVKFSLRKGQHDEGQRDGDKSVTIDSMYTGSHFKPQGYTNHYVHGLFAALAAASLASLSPEEDQVLEAHASKYTKKANFAISQQIKAFSSAASRFFWPSSDRKLWEVPRERCGWCYTCQAPPNGRRGCMLNAAASAATRGAVKILGVHTIKNGENSLSSISTYISLMEKSFHGLISGPFVNENFRRRWHEALENVSSHSVMKILLLDLEENMRPVALSGDWVKLVDDCLIEGPVQGATHTVSAQKRGPGGRRNRKQTSASEVEAEDRLERSFTWWRGGKLSKLLFSKAILPSSVIKKAARQGGKKKVPGVHYSDGVEIPRRNRRSMWRAAVEMSKTVSQLAFQVRYIDLYLRWNDLVRPEPSVQDSKGLETEASVFRNAVVCDRKVSGSKLLYGVYFGAQKHLPSRVMKAIIDTEQGQDGKEKNWFSEAHIPLYLIKEYEERVKLPPPTSKLPSDALSKVQKMQLRGARMDVFSYLTCKRDNVEKFACSSCGLDVPLRKVLICRKCQGKCHHDCIIGSNTLMNKEYLPAFTCKRCYHAEAFSRIKNIESPTSPLLLQTQEHPKVRTVSEVHKVKKKTPVAAVKPEVQKVKQKTPLTAVKPENNKEKKGANSIPKSTTKGKKVTLGIIWKKNADAKTDKEADAFRLENVIPKGMEVSGSPPICKLCEKPYNPNLMYVRCPSCSNWFHADALMLDESRLPEMLGFKCCKCRRIKSADCPYDERPKTKTAKKQQRPISLKQESLFIDSDSGDISELRGWEPTSSSPLNFVGDMLAQEDDPLVNTVSRVEQLQDDNSMDVEFEWGAGATSAPGPQKLPVRRQMKNDDMYFDATAPFEMDSPVYEDAGEEKAASSPPLAAWDGPIDYEDGGLTINCEEMVYEPQTYFSFTELLAAEDDGGVDTFGGTSSPPKWANLDEEGASTSLTDDLGFTISMDAPVDIRCRICSNGDPDLFCESCCLWIHSNCSPWDESEMMGNSGWRCGDCRDWR